MAELGLAEDDLDNLIVEDEEDIPENQSRWRAVARVHTPKSYSKFWFFKNMRSAWDLAKPVTIKPLALLEIRPLMAHQFWPLMAHFGCAITTTPLVSRSNGAHFVRH